MLIQMTLLIEITNLSKEEFDEYKADANDPAAWQQAVGDDNMKVLRVSCVEVEQPINQAE